MTRPTKGCTPAEVGAKVGIPESALGSAPESAQEIGLLGGCVL